ncbi:MAG: hypothetical protein J3K34DRAFT_45760 [Monoraphidium minutum]|nr:MAG: hypothetical protein J3K34DRAFT_45760 [Monoraphidium minutum]
MARARPSSQWALAALMLVVASPRLAARAERAAAHDKRVEELLKLEAQYPGAPLQFDDDAFKTYALSGSRPYHLVIFGTSAGVMTREYARKYPALKMRALRNNWLPVARAFKSGPDASKIFLVEMYWETARETFAHLNISMLPYLAVWGPEVGGGAEGEPPVRPVALNSTGSYAYPWPPEFIASFISTHTRLTHAPVAETPHALPWYFPLLALLGLAAAAAGARLFYWSPLARAAWPWQLAALGMWWFATSGGMFVYIRGMPLMMRAGSKPVIALEQSEGQLGLEGYLMGSIYILFALLVSSMVYVLPHVKHPRLRGGLSVGAACLAAFAAQGAIVAYRFKMGGGLGLRSFFFA